MIIDLRWKDRKEEHVTVLQLSYYDKKCHIIFQFFSEFCESTKLGLLECKISFSGNNLNI